MELASKRRFMNKKYVKYSALIVFLMICKPSFAMDNKSNKKGLSWEQAVAIAVGVAVVYVTTPVNPIFGKIVASLYDDVSPETKKWAKKVFSESGIKDADKIPLKKGKDGQEWGAAGSHFIIVPNDFDPTRCSCLERLANEFALKHEIKHVQNYDNLKKRALFVGTIALGLSTEKPSLTIPIISVGYGVNMAYSKYLEGEADRFAYERATSREELEAANIVFKEYGARYKDIIMSNASLVSFNFIERQVLSKISRNLNDIQLEFSVVGDSSLKIEELERKQEQLFDAAYFITEREHPSWKSRAIMAQEYINKWDEKHNKQLNMFEMNKKA
jgi:hypothetical protein